ncbi:hypothetical protein ABZ330_00215 [Streptomyces sp. NPDC006172]|uniref:hypothetical protein n=1 Tax=Streptomyces sp. NPDC006172 TaxID=3154470 RepID=UPI00340C5E1D
MNARRIIAALFVDLGEGREIKKGDRAGQIRWDRLPRARYECLLCGTSEVPDGRGPGDIARFVASIRTDHACGPLTEQRAA